MSKIGVVAAHLAAWLVPLLGVAACASVWPSLGPGVDINVTDSSFMVLHGHFTLLPVLLVCSVTLAGLRFRALNLPIRLAWAALAVHIVSVALLLRDLRSLPASTGHDPVWIFIPSHPALGYVYLGSALLAMGVALVGSLLSVWQTVRMPRVKLA